MRSATDESSDTTDAFDCNEEGATVLLGVRRPVVKLSTELSSRTESTMLDSVLCEGLLFTSLSTAVLLWRRVDRPTNSSLDEAPEIV